MAEKMEKEDFSIEESLKKIEAITAVLELSLIHISEPTRP